MKLSFIVITKMIHGWKKCELHGLEGMTWGDWVSSKYNIYEFSTHGRPSFVDTEVDPQDAWGSIIGHGNYENHNDVPVRCYEMLVNGGEYTAYFGK